MNTYRISIHPFAQGDLNDIYQYIKDVFKAPLTAQRFVYNLVANIQTLSYRADTIGFCSHPYLTRLYGKNIKRINFKKIAIIFVIDGEDVLVLRILNAEMI